MTPQSLEYKFTLGAWAHEALDAEGQKRPNADLTVEGLVHVQDTVLAWSDANTARRVVGQITGELESLGVHEAEGLLPREVWVWSPPQTNPPTPIQRVLVMHDGQNVVDPATSNFGVDWGVDEVLDSLVRAGAVPRTLLVTAACTAERSAEYGPGQRGARYVDWLMTENSPRMRHEVAGASKPIATSLGGRRHLHVDCVGWGSSMKARPGKATACPCGSTTAPWGSILVCRAWPKPWTSTMWSRCGHFESAICMSRLNPVRTARSSSAKAGARSPYLAVRAISNSRLLSGFAVRAPTETTEFAGKRRGWRRNRLISHRRSDT